MGVRIRKEIKANTAKKIQKPKLIFV